MAFRFDMIAAGLSGSVVSVLLAVLLMLKFDSAFVAMVPTILIPPLACWAAGLRHRSTLVMIAVYATIGWFAGAGLTSSVAMSRQSRIEENAKRPLAGYDPILPCAICGGIFAFGRACFISSPESSTIDESIVSSGEH